MTGEIDLAAIGAVKGEENEVAKKEENKSKSAMRKELEKKLVGTKWKDAGRPYWRRVFKKSKSLAAGLCLDYTRWS